MTLLATNARALSGSYSALIMMSFLMNSDLWRTLEKVQFREFCQPGIAL